MTLPEVTLLTDAAESVKNALAKHLDRRGRMRGALADAPQFAHAAVGLFGLPSHTAIAPLRYLGDGGEPGTDLWACADPVHLAVRGDGVAILPLGLTLPVEDVDGFRAVLGEVFSGGATRSVCVADRGYVGGPMLADANFTPLSMARGRDLKPALPAGPTGPQWRRRMTEAQMLLHDAPFNAARAARGAPAINGVWFWGAGSLPEPAPPTFTHVWSNEPLAIGLARHAGIAHSLPPDDADAWLRQLAPGKHLWVAEGAAETTASKADAATAYLLQALAEEKIARLNLVIGDRLLQLTPRDLGPWWRRAWSRRPRSRRAPMSHP